MAPTRVALVGAAGETGTSIVNGLLEAGDFSIIALTRPSSLTKPANVELKSRGVEIVAADLEGPEDDLVKVLEGVEVVISAVSADQQYAQIPLASAAKKAGVKRFVPCAFITVCPPRGVMMLRDWKEDVYNHIKKIKLGYTIIDVGWWYQIGIPRLPSGKIDYFTGPQTIFNTLVDDGNTPSALTDVRDIGPYVAAIIKDERTLNKYVLAYDEVLTPNQVFDKVERISGETIPRKNVTEAELLARLAEANEALKKDPKDPMASIIKIGAEYSISWGVRADNTPEYAKYLGYLTTKELYPDLKLRSLEDFLADVLAGKAKGVYQNNETMKAVMEKANK